LIFSACKVLILQNEKGLGISGITEWIYCVIQFSVIWQPESGKGLEVSVHYWLDSLFWVWEKQSIMIAEAIVGGGCTFPHDKMYSSLLWHQGHSSSN
jgi:hypothetical protein